MFNWQHYRSNIVKFFFLLLFIFTSCQAIAAEPAPPIEGISAWINSPPLNLSALKGKVVLIDFWAYSCVNCVRTLPYVKSWYDKYHDQGLVIIGVHSPEFPFESQLDNVKMAVTKYGIHYPVALDNNFVTWRNYHNEFWPAHYLIDQQGNIVYQHFGEGDYLVTENNIRRLLSLKPLSSTDNPSADSGSFFQTPETYLGYDRAANFNSPEAAIKDIASAYTFPADLPRNGWALQGRWVVNADKIVNLDANDAIKIHFYAHKVFMVAGTTQGKPIKVSILLDNKPMGSVVVNQHNLYPILVLPSIASGVLELRVSDPGIEIYTFTFG